MAQWGYDAHNGKSLFTIHPFVIKLIESYHSLTGGMLLTIVDIFLKNSLSRNLLKLTTFRIGYKLISDRSSFQIVNLLFHYFPTFLRFHMQIRVTLS